jgi:hypothetical protein
MTEEDAKPVVQEHLVLIVPGIRDYGLWIEEMAPTLREAGYYVEPASLDYYNVLQFLTPVPFFRERAIAQIWEDIQAAILRHPTATKISFIAHSFGSYMVAENLRRQFILASPNLKVHRVIFCGSIVPTRFPFQQISNRIGDDVINEVGAFDSWPAVAESILFGYGHPGTFGFKRPFVRDRWHKGASHNYYLNPDFMKQWWLPLLGGVPPAAGDPPEKPPQWIILLSIFKPKYLLSLVAILLAAYFGIRAIYPPEALASQNQTPSARLGAPEFPSVYPQNGLMEVIERATERTCPMGPICPPQFVQRILWGRSFETVFMDGQLSNIVTLAAFEFPPRGETVYDPVDMLRGFASRFGGCVTVDESGPQTKVTVNEERVTHKARSNDADLLICDQ